MTAPLYQTTDIALAAFLLSRGHAPVSWKRLTPKKVLFRFAASEALHHLLRLYWGGQPVLAVPARLFAALRMLKSRALVRAGGELLDQAPDCEGDADGPAGDDAEPLDRTASPL